VTDARALYKEGLEHFVDEHYEEAIACYRRSIEADGGFALAWNGLAMALSRHGDLEGAIEAGRRLVELEPDEPLAHTSLSIFYQQKGMIAEAEEEKAVAMRLQMRKQGS
jgi:Flp pilus assembly protein TadD